MNYLDVLNNEIVVKNYNAIDEINPFPFNHGLRHVTNVCKIMDKLCDTLKIEGEEKETLLVAAALHDIGQVDGREGHGRKAKEFLIANFENEFKDGKFYNEMLTAIEQHDNKCVVENPLFTLLLQFCDKMDFSKERLEENYKEKFGYRCWENVDRVDYIYNDNQFGINIITSGVEEFDRLFSREKFSGKVVNAVNVLAEKLGKEPVILNNGEVMNINFNNFIILHGSFGSKDGNWFPWLKGMLEGYKYEVDVPQMPVGVGNQNFDNWSKEFDKLKIDEKTVIIAHSIAPIFVCKYLISKKIKVRKLVFVCGFNNYLGIDPDFDAVNESMFTDNLQEIKEYCPEIICYYSDNDPYVRFDVEKEFADIVATRQHIIKDGGHINAESGYTEFEEILKELI